MKETGKASNSLTIWGIVTSQVGLFLLFVIAIYGMYFGYWSHLAGPVAVVCGTAWAIGGVILLFAGGFRTTGAIQAVGGLAGAVTAFLSSGPSSTVYAIEGTAALLCTASYVYNIAYALPERVRMSCYLANNIFLAVCIAVAVNIISYKSFKRFDLTSTKFFELADVTKRLLKGLDDDLKITVFMRPRIVEYGRARPNPIYNYTKELMERFRNENPTKVHVEWLDPDWDKRRATELLKEYGVGAFEVRNKLGVVVLEYKGGHKYITSEDMAEFERTPARPFASRYGRMKAFTAEASLVAALKSLISGKKTVLYFVTGHGEKDPTVANPAKKLTVLKQMLERENFEIKKIDDLAVKGVPKDCDILIVAGPKRPLTPREGRIIQMAFNKGTNMILMLDPIGDFSGENFAPTGLEKLLSEVGVIPDNDIITGLVRLLGTIARINPVSAHPRDCSHTIINELKDAGAKFSFDYPRSFTIKQKNPFENKYIVYPLCKVYSPMWGETDYAGFRRGRFMKDASDKSPPLTVAAAVAERLNAPTGKRGTFKMKPRMVLFGDSDFILDNHLTGWNYDLLLNSIYWLAPTVDKKMIGIAPKTPERVKFNISIDKLSGIAWSIVFGLPAAVLLLGAFVWWKRRK